MRSPCPPPSAAAGSSVPRKASPSRHENRPLLPLGDRTARALPEESRFPGGSPEGRERTDREIESRPQRFLFYFRSNKERSQTVGAALAQGRADRPAGRRAGVHQG